VDLTAIQEDYLEAIYHLEKPDNGGVRTTDLAERLQCRLPTVTRTVRRMAMMGLVSHEARGLIHLTRSGARTAASIAHRHSDIVSFLTQILGLDKEQADSDACQMEHGLSPLAAERLHEFLEYIDQLSADQRRVFTLFGQQASARVREFSYLPDGKTVGWRS
jgi:DtxR family Mn-dependent transcriptional regulator